MQNFGLKNNLSFYLKVNLFRLNPCKEYLILKLKFKKVYVDFQLICNELLYLGLTEEELADLSIKISELLEKRKSKASIIRVMLRYAKAKRTKKRAD